jgi:hypothetical protein
MVAGAIAAFFTTAQAMEKGGACKDDVAKLCPGVQPGEGKILSCLKEHKSEVSPGCTSYLKQVGQQMKAVSDACEQDVEKYCWDTPMGKGGIANCLKKHSADLSPDCKSAVAKAKSKKAKS